MKSDRQKSEVEEARDPNANYYMCIGEFRGIPIYSINLIYSYCLSWGAIR